MKKAMKWYEILWQLPQWILGTVYMYILGNKVTDGFMYNGARYFVSKSQQGSVTFCKDYIFMSKAAQHSGYVIKHEYGHTLQSRYLGWLYLIVIGIPSFLWAFVHSHFTGNKRYYSFPTEKWADRLGGN